MATLAANASATQERLKVSAIPAGDYFQIDDEIVRVIDKRTTQLTILVERAYAGTTAATHNSGAELTPLYVPSTGGGGGQLITLLGPFPVEFDTPDIDETDPAGVTLTTVETGKLILDAWFYGSDGAGTGTLAVGADAGDAGSLTLCSGTVLSLSGDPEGLQNAVSSMHFETGGPVVCPEDIRVYIQLSGGDWTAGEARVYVLVAEPAS